MERDVDAYDGNGGGTASEGDGLGACGIYGDVSADEGEEGAGIQVLGGEGVGGVGQSIEGFECACADVLLKLNVVIYDFKQGSSFATNQIYQSYKIGNTPTCDLSALEHKHAAQQ